MVGGVPMLEFYNARIPEWKNVDYYCNTYRSYQCRSGTALGAFSALESTLKNDLLQWEITAARYMNDENHLINTISSYSKEIQTLRQETYDKEMPAVKRQSHFRRMATLNALRNQKQSHLNLIADVLILICRRVRKLRAASAGDANRSE